MRRADIPTFTLIGLLDIGANLLFALGLSLGSDPVVSGVASLYPLTTVVLAQLTLRERLTVTQGAGLAATLAGLLLVGLTGAGP